MMNEPRDPEKIVDDVDRRPSVIVTAGEVVNASGHPDQLKRHFGLLSICGLALTIDNAWVALGGSIAVSISQYFMRSELQHDWSLTQKQTTVGLLVYCTSC